VFEVGPAARPRGVAPGTDARPHDHRLRRRPEAARAGLTTVCSRCWRRAGPRASCCSNGAAAAGRPASRCRRSGRSGGPRVPGRGFRAAGRGFRAVAASSRRSWVLRRGNRSREVHTDRAEHARRAASGCSDTPVTPRPPHPVPCVGPVIVGPVCSARAIAVPVRPRQVDHRPTHAHGDHGAADRCHGPAGPVVRRRPRNAGFRATGASRADRGFSALTIAAAKCIRTARGRLAARWRSPFRCVNGGSAGARRTRTPITGADDRCHGPQGAG
jgi:hypothetical protein